MPHKPSGTRGLGGELRRDIYGVGRHAREQQRRCWEQRGSQERRWFQHMLEERRLGNVGRTAQTQFMKLSRCEGKAEAWQLRRRGKVDDQVWRIYRQMIDQRNGAGFLQGSKRFGEMVEDWWEKDAPMQYEDEAEIAEALDIYEGGHGPTKLLPVQEKYAPGDLDPCWDDGEDDEEGGVALGDFTAMGKSIYEIHQEEGGAKAKYWWQGPTARATTSLVMR